MTPAALALVREALSAQAEASSLALWLEVNGIANGLYSYDLWFGPRSTIAEGDATQIEDEVFFVVPAESIERLRGAVLDLSERRGEPVLSSSTRTRPGCPDPARGPWRSEGPGSTGRARCSRTPAQPVPRRARRPCRARGSRRSCRLCRDVRRLPGLRHGSSNPERGDSGGDHRRRSRDPRGRGRDRPRLGDAAFLRAGTGLAVPVSK